MTLSFCKQTSPSFCSTALYSHDYACAVLIFFLWSYFLFSRESQSESNRWTHLKLDNLLNCVFNQCIFSDFIYFNDSFTTILSEASYWLSVAFSLLMWKSYWAGDVYLISFTLTCTLFVLSPKGPIRDVRASQVCTRIKDFLLLLIYSLFTNRSNVLWWLNLKI